MTLYIDVILLENIMMNSIILLTTAIICKARIRYFRLLIASLIGSVYTVVWYVSHLKIYTTISMKLLLSIGMIYVAYRASHWKIFWKQCVIFYLTSFCLGGAAYYLLYGIRPYYLQNVNRNTYGKLSCKNSNIRRNFGIFNSNNIFQNNKKQNNEKRYDV